MWYFGVARFLLGPAFAYPCSCPPPGSPPPEQVRATLTRFCIKVSAGAFHNAVDRAPVNAYDCGNVLNGPTIILQVTDGQVAPRFGIAP